jgi:hypothetical protein
MTDLDSITDAAVTAGRSPLAWRQTSDMLWRAAQTLLRQHAHDVRLGRAGASTIDTHNVRLFAVIFRRTHAAPPPAVAPVYMMIAGLSLEALVKGILVAREPTRISAGADGHKLDIAWKAPEHLSLDLMRAAGYQTTAEEKSLIERLAMFVRWAGRYPTPKLAAELGPGLGEAERGAFWREGDFEVLKLLRNRLRDDLSQIISDNNQADGLLIKRASVILKWRSLRETEGADGV